MNIAWDKLRRCNRANRRMALRVSVLILILVLSLAGCSDSAADSPETAVPVTEATVERVVDGDTLVVNLNGTEEKVRLIGVNTPETHHPSKPVEEYGPEAEEFTRSQLDGKRIYLEFDVEERDKYGRILAYVWLEKPQSEAAEEIRTKMFNAVLLTEGYAQVMTVAPNVKYADLFVKLQAEAREAGRGLWKQSK